MVCRQYMTNHIFYKDNRYSVNQNNLLCTMHKLVRLFLNKNISLLRTVQIQRHCQRFTTQRDCTVQIQRHSQLFSIQRYCTVQMQRHSQLVSIQRDCTVQIQRHSQRHCIQPDCTEQIQQHRQRHSIQRRGQRNFPWCFRCRFFAECHALDKDIFKCA